MDRQFFILRINLPKWQPIFIHSVDNLPAFRKMTPVQTNPYHDLCHLFFIKNNKGLFVRDAGMNGVTPQSNHLRPEGSAGKINPRA
jgi:hypothetical protein